MSNEAPPPDDKPLLTDAAVRNRLGRIEGLLRRMAKLARPESNREPTGTEDPAAILQALDARVQELEKASATWTPYADRIESLRAKVSGLEDLLEGVDVDEIRGLGSRAEELAKALPDGSPAIGEIVRRLERAEVQLETKLEQGPSPQELSERLDDVEDQLGTNLSFLPPGYPEPSPRDYSLDYETESEALARALSRGVDNRFTDYEHDELVEDETSKLSDRESMDRVLELERRLESVNLKTQACLRELEKLRNAAKTRQLEISALENRLTSAIHYTAEEAHELTLPSPKVLRAKLRDEGFLIDLPTTTELVKALQYNRLVILEGPPGSGKTTLARLLGKAITGQEPDYAEVSAEWTHYDAVGGVRMIGGSFAAHLGALSRAVVKCIESEGRHWLILDEINRGDYASFLSGAHQLFDLPNGIITLDMMFPERGDPRGTLRVPPAFRVLAAMNTSDKGRLFNISDGLRRRSRTIVLKPPSAEEEIGLALIEAERALATNARSIDKEQLRHLATVGLGFVQRIRDINAKATGRSNGRVDVGTWVFVDFVRSAAQELHSKTSIGLDPALDKAIATTLLERLSIDSPDLARQLIVAIHERNWPLTRNSLQDRTRRTSSY